MSRESSKQEREPQCSKHREQPYQHGDEILLSMKNQDDKLGKLYSDESVLYDKLRVVIKEEHNLTVKMDALVFALEAVSDVNIELTCNPDIDLET
jgi:uncharacterized lipoprotein YehR (DUF1307 family)